MDANSPTYRLAFDGDQLETSCWSLFIRDQFTAYELFWLYVVIPTTRRPEDLHFKSDAELKAAGVNRFDVYLAQLHYSVLWHLAAADRLLEQSSGLVGEGFTNFIIRLSAATDSADELLQRYDKPHQDPWSQPPSVAQKARRDWRNTHAQQPSVHALDALRRYRNHLIHSGAFMSLEDEHVGTLYPNVGGESKYRDWRKVTLAALQLAGFPYGDFSPASHIAHAWWDEVLAYLQGQWELMLLARKLSTQTLPEPEPRVDGDITATTTTTTSTYVTSSRSYPLSTSFIPPEWLRGPGRRR